VIKFMQWNSDISILCLQQRNPPSPVIHISQRTGYIWCLTSDNMQKFSCGMYQEPFNLVYCRRRALTSGTGWSRTGHIRWSRMSRTQAWGRRTRLRIEEMLLLPDHTYWFGKQTFITHFSVKWTSSHLFN